MLDQARLAQISSLEHGEEPPDEGLIFTRSAFRNALPEVSQVRLEQTIYAEFPALKERIEGLRGEKTNQTGETLADLWGTSVEEAHSTASDLVDVERWRWSRGLPTSHTTGLP